jgi:hypothetical protein
MNHKDQEFEQLLKTLSGLERAGKVIVIIMYAVIIGGIISLLWT